MDVRRRPAPTTDKTQVAPRPMGMSASCRKTWTWTQPTARCPMCGEKAGRGVAWTALDMSGCDRKLENGLHPLVVNSLGGPC